MRYGLLFCLMLGGSFLMTAQEVVEQGFGIEVAPHYGSTRVSQSGIVSLELERQDSLEAGAVGYGFGLLYTSRVDKIGFTTGVRFLETGYEVGEQPVQRQSEGETFSQEVKARYISIPFELNFYQDITPRNRVFFTLGAAAHFHLVTRVNQANFLRGAPNGTENFKREEGITYRSPVFSLNTGVGFDKKFNDRWSLRFEPFFQFFLQGSERTDMDQINRNYYQLGGRVLVRRSF